MQHVAGLRTCIAIFYSLCSSCLSVCPSEPFYGIDYGPFREGQSPGGIYPAIEQIHEDLQILAGKTRCIRTYGIDETLAAICPLCEQYGLECYIGCYISGDAAADQNTLSELAAIATTCSAAKGLLIGNEYISADFFDPNRVDYLIRLIQQVQILTDLPVSTGEEWVYWHIYPELAATVDFIASHHYAFARGIPIERAATENVLNYDAMKNAYPDKEVILFETGWPSEGSANGESIPSPENQARFLREFLPAAKLYNIKCFIFSAFDEPWKYDPNAAYEAHWGLYKVDRESKPAVVEMLTALQTDVNYDSMVDLRDFSYLAEEWLLIRNQTDLCGAGDFNYDGITDLNDAASLASQWLGE